MRGTGVGEFIALLIIGFVLGALFVNAYLAPVPRCAEDVVIVGQGQFEAGLWASYECGPALDDYGKGN